MPSRDYLLPAGVCLVLALLAYVLDFNGLYGQDAHEYLRQTRVFFDRLNGLPEVSPERGAAEFGAGFPLLGAVLTFLTGNPVVALQWITWISAGAAVYFFQSGCRYLLPGSKTDSRFLYGLFFISAPLMVRAGFTSMSDMPALAMSLAAIRYGADGGEHRDGRLLAWAVLDAGIAILIRPAMVLLLAPVMVWAVWRILPRKPWWVLLAVGIGGGLAGVYFWSKKGVETGLPTVLNDWSVLNFFKRHFSTVTGTLDYTLPNGIHIFSPLGHYGFFAATFLLFFLFKKTDLHLPVKRVLLISLAGYMLLIGGLPVQSIRYLLPVWALGLLLLFPAWDRFYAYGTYFFSGLVKMILAVGLCLQIAGIVWLLWPVLSRHHTETAIARRLSSVLPPGAAVYTMDIDIALKTYLPDMEYRNIWAQSYDSIPAGTWFLYNENKLGKQWAGQNPVINWEMAQRTGHLTRIDSLPDGWILWQAGRSAD